MRSKLKAFTKKLVWLVLNPRFLVCFGMAWIITNGWSYIAFAVGTLCEIGWMMAVSGAYLTFLWLPFTPEKVLTLTIAILLLRKLFPHDEKTLGVLRDMFSHLRQKNAQRRRDHTRKEKSGAEPQKE